MRFHGTLSIEKLLWQPEKTRAANHRHEKAKMANHRVLLTSVQHLPPHLLLERTTNRASSPGVNEFLLASTRENILVQADRSILRVELLGLLGFMRFATIQQRISQQNTRDINMAAYKASAHSPQPAYQASPGSILHPNVDLYNAIANAHRTLTESFTLPIRSGRAWTVPQGHMVRISTPEGPQVGDLNIWNLHNPRERFWAARTRQLHASHVSTYDRLWSCLPYLRPLVTIVADSLKDYGVDEWGGRCHGLLGTRCDPYVNHMLSGDSYDYHCHSNLTRAVLPHGLTEFDVHDVINLFQVTGLDKDGKYFMEACPAKRGDFIELFAEQPLLMALSTCPGGDLSTWGWGEGGDGAEGEKKSMLECCRPLKVEVFRLKDDDALKEWKPPEPVAYRGSHGMTVPDGEKGI